MKNILIVASMIFTMLLSSCEESVDVDTKTAAPKLVVDASLTWKKGTAGNEQKIRLSTTTNYFDKTSPPVSGATVYVTNSANTTFYFIETPNTGDYVCSSFISEIGDTYTLTIQYNGQTFTANEELKAVVFIDSVIQEIKPGIGGEDDLIQIKSFFTDPASSNDFYLLRFQSTIAAIPEYDVFDDEFFQGNQVFGIYIDPELKAGDLLEIKLYGISQRYLDYMTKLLGITENTGPFSTPPAMLRGNIINMTNPDNYALGYFSVSEIDSQLYTVK